MSLTTKQKKGLHTCPKCGHLDLVHYIGECLACDPDLYDHDPCGRIPKLIETTYENVEALLAETVAAMRAELDAAEAEVNRLREGIEAPADELDSVDAVLERESSGSTATATMLGREAMRYLRRLLDGGA